MWIIPVGIFLSKLKHDVLKLIRTKIISHHPSGVSPHEDSTHELVHHPHPHERCLGTWERQMLRIDNIRWSHLNPRNQRTINFCEAKMQNRKKAHNVESSGYTSFSIHRCRFPIPCRLAVVTVGITCVLHGMKKLMWDNAV